MTYSINIFPEGTPPENRCDYWCMKAIEYDETINEDGEDILVSHSTVPHGRDISEFTVRILSTAEATAKMTLILTNKFTGFRGLVWEAMLGVMG